jgi:VIT1/CCC1 family predicted Fe2+/Mn2+ transporter
VALVLWAVLSGIGVSEWGSSVLTAAAIALGVHSGVAAMLAIRSELARYGYELERERDEISRHPEWEREEVWALYEAKGFSGEALERIVDTLCSDDERLLKVMFEEELGIFFEQVNHPVVVGVVTGASAAAGGLVVALSAASAWAWAPAAATGLLLIVVAAVRARAALRQWVESFVRWSVTAGTVAAIGYFVGRLVGGADVP